MDDMSCGCDLLNMEATAGVLVIAEVGAQSERHLETCDDLVKKPRMFVSLPDNIENGFICADKKEFMKQVYDHLMDEAGYYDDETDLDCLAIRVKMLSNAEIRLLADFRGF